MNLSTRIALILWPLVKPVLLRAGRALRDRWAAELKASDAAAGRAEMRALALCAALSAALLTGCAGQCQTLKRAYVWAWDQIEQTVPDAAEPAPAEPAPVPAEPPAAEAADIPAGTTWLHTDVSGWPITATLSGVTVSGSTVTLSYDKATVWPGTSTTAGDGLNANPWVFVNLGGAWYAATWEWLRAGQTAKARYAVAGDHIKRAPLSDWTPASGETIGFMVSGLARADERNVRERSNIVWVTWP